jgi:SPP1 gp7 family putative phage head morphogenesis protein
MTDKLFDPPENANEALFDAMVRHQIYILSLSGSVRNKIDKLLNATESSIAEKIRDRLRNSNGLNSSMEVHRMEVLIKIIKSIRTKAWSQITKAWVEELVGIAKVEPELLQSIVVTTSPTVVETVLPPVRLLASIVTARAFEGRTLRSWAKSIAAEDIRRIESAIRIGMVAGESSDVIARRVVGSARLAGADGVTEITRQQAAAITRTAVNFVANEARSEFMMANSDLFEEEQYVATLDSRTTPVCRSNDGKRFPIGKGPRPPLHFNCRSIRVPVLHGDVVSERPAKASTRRMILREFTAKEGIKVSSRDALPRGMKGAFDKFERQRVRDLTGQVAGVTTYQQWLKRQSTEFQNDVLGKTRAALFRKGGLQLDNFVNRTGNQIKLSELAKKHADAFHAAGLDPAAFK